MFDIEGVVLAKTIVIRLNNLALSTSRAPIAALRLPLLGRMLFGFQDSTYNEFAISETPNFRLDGLI